MGKVLSSVGNVLGFGGGGAGAAPVLDKKAFDISQQAKEYEDRLKNQADYTSTQNRSLSDALAQQARGEGPLAGVAMKQAANRSLAQTLSAAQAMGGSPLAARNIMQARGQTTRDLAELGMQERLAAQQALGQHLERAAGTQRADVSAGFGIARAPQDMMADYERQRFAADVARQNAIQAQQAQMGSALLGTAGQLGAAYLTGGASLAAQGLKTTPFTGGSASMQGYNQLPGTEMAAHGGIVPGQPDKIDTKANDTVPAQVSPGEMVIPVTVVQAGPKAVQKFADALLKQQQQQKDAPGGYATIAAMKKGKKNGGR